LDLIGPSRFRGNGRLRRLACCRIQRSHSVLAVAMAQDETGAFDRNEQDHDQSDRD
jgi:hypothetical protein